MGDSSCDGWRATNCSRVRTPSARAARLELGDAQQVLRLDQERALREAARVGAEDGQGLVPALGAHQLARGRVGGGGGQLPLRLVLQQEAERRDGLVRQPQLQLAEAARVQGIHGVRRVRTDPQELRVALPGLVEAAEPEEHLGLPEDRLADGEGPQRQAFGGPELGQRVREPTQREGGLAAQHGGVAPARVVGLRRLEEPAELPVRHVVEPVVEGLDAHRPEPVGLGDGGRDRPGDGGDREEEQEQSGKRPDHDVHPSMLLTLSDFPAEDGYTPGA